MKASALRTCHSDEPEALIVDDPEDAVLLYQKYLQSIVMPTPMNTDHWCMYEGQVFGVAIELRSTELRDVRVRDISVPQLRRGQRGLHTQRLGPHGAAQLLAWWHQPTALQSPRHPLHSINAYHNREGPRGFVPEVPHVTKGPSGPLLVPNEVVWGPCWGRPPCICRWLGSWYHPKYPWGISWKWQMNPPMWKHFRIDCTALVLSYQPLV